VALSCGGGKILDPNGGGLSMVEGTRLMHSRDQARIVRAGQKFTTTQFCEVGVARHPMVIDTNLVVSFDPFPVRVQWLRMERMFHVVGIQKSNGEVLLLQQPI
jgi:hypothetical protein